MQKTRKQTGTELCQAELTIDRFTRSNPLTKKIKWSSIYPKNKLSSIYKNAEAIFHSQKIDDDFHLQQN